MRAPNLLILAEADLWLEYKRIAFRSHACFICDQKRWCEHREKEAVSIPAFWKWLEERRNAA